MVKVIIFIEGYVVHAEMNREQLTSMQEEGINVFEHMYTVPSWAMEMGLGGIFFIAQDLWNFRNPFRKHPPHPPL